MFTRPLSYLGATLAFGVVVAGTPAWAETVDTSTCTFFCGLTSSASNPPEPAAAPSSDAATAAEASDTPTVPKAKPRPKVVPVVIAAEAPEAASTAALATGLTGHSVRIVRAATPRALRSADLSVAPLAGPQTPRADGVLFREDLHVVARDGVSTLADLEGRTVSLGADGSPAQAIARRVLAARHINVKDMPLDLDNALDGLVTGDLDAVFVLAPPRFARLKNLPGDGLHLLAAASSAADGADLSPSAIPASAYPALKAAAATPTLSVAVQATANPKSAHPREAAAVLAALTARARKTLALARPESEMRSVALSR